MAVKGHRQDVSVREYTDIKVCWHDLNQMKAQYKYFRDKKENLKKSLEQMVVVSDETVRQIRWEMYSCRIMLGILEVKITKTTSILKKLQKKESNRQRMEKIKEQKKREREYGKRFTGPSVTDENGIKYYVTEEHREELMTRIKEVSNQINEKGRKGSSIRVGGGVKIKAGR